VDHDLPAAVRCLDGGGDDLIRTALDDRRCDGGPCMADGDKAKDQHRPEHSRRHGSRHASRLTPIAEVANSFGTVTRGNGGSAPRRVARTRYRQTASVGMMRSAPLVSELSEALRRLPFDLHGRNLAGREVGNEMRPLCRPAPATRRTRMKSKL